jgi:hypothetical protein
MEAILGVLKGEDAAPAVAGPPAGGDPGD